MIFDVFNRDFDAYLNEIEFTLWQSILHKPEPKEDTWANVLQMYATSESVDSKKGKMNQTDEAISKIWSNKQNLEQLSTLQVYDFVILSNITV